MHCCHAFPINSPPRPALPRPPKCKQTAEIHEGAKKVQRGPQTVRCQRRDRIVFSWSCRFGLQSQSHPEQVWSRWHDFFTFLDVIFKLNFAWQCTKYFCNPRKLSIMSNLTCSPLKKLHQDLRFVKPNLILLPLISLTKITYLPSTAVNITGMLACKNCKPDSVVWCVIFWVIVIFFEKSLKIASLSNDKYFIFLFRLDQILGRQGSKAKDVYDSKQSLASRIVKTERQVRWCHQTLNEGSEMTFTKY